LLTLAEKICKQKSGSKTEVSETIARGSEIKLATAFWWLTQISPADFETKCFSLVQNLGGRTSAVCADFCSRPHRQLVSLTAVTPPEKSQQIFVPPLLQQKPRQKAILAWQS
jgi:hypothetical protein